MNTTEAKATIQSMILGKLGAESEADEIVTERKRELRQATDKKREIQDTIDALCLAWDELPGMIDDDFSKVRDRCRTAKERRNSQQMFEAMDT